MYCVLLTTQKAQQNIRDQIRGDEIRDRNFCTLWVEKVGLRSTGRRQVRQTMTEIHTKKGGRGEGDKTQTILLKLQVWRRAMIKKQYLSAESLF